MARDLFAQQSGRNLFSQDPPTPSVATSKEEVALKEPSLADRAIGAGEAALAIATGVPAQLASGYAGLAGSIDGLEEGAKAVDRVQSLAYTPKTDEGVEALEAVGDAAGFVGESISRVPAGLKGLFDLATGKGLDQAVDSINEIKEQGAASMLGDYVADTTGSPELATAVSMAPEIAATIIPAFKIKGAKNRALMQAVEANSPKTIDYIVKGSKAVKSKAVKEARKSGVLDDATTLMIKGADTSDKKAALNMIETAKKSLIDKKSQYIDRTYDEAGSALKGRIDILDKTINDYGKRIGDVTRNMTQTVDMDTPINNFTKSLYEDLGVRFSQKGGRFSPVFKGSAIEDNGQAKRAISILVERIQSPKIDNASYNHNLKKYIDEKVTYGKDVEGIKGKTERALKAFRSDINNTLQDAVPEYRELNQVYSRASDLKGSIKDSIGSKVNLKDKKALGTAARALGNNTQKRGNMINTLNDIESFTDDMKIKTDGDVLTQFIVADELDNLLGGQAKTGFKGQISEGVSAAVDAATGNTPSGIISKAGRLISKEKDTAEKLNLYEKAIKDMINE